MASEETEMDISSLPLEVLEHIFSHLPVVTSNPFDSDFSDLSSAILVSRTWKSVGESELLWKDARLVINSSERLDKFMAEEIPQRFRLVKSIEVTSQLSEQQSIPHLEDWSVGIPQLREKLAEAGPRIQNLSIYPFYLMPSTLRYPDLQRSIAGLAILFPSVTPSTLFVQAKATHQDSTTHIVFLRELLNRVRSSQIALKTLDIRGIELALEGPSGMTSLKSQFTSLGVKVISQ